MSTTKAHIYKKLNFVDNAYCNDFIIWRYNHDGSKYYVSFRSYTEGNKKYYGDPDDVHNYNIILILYSSPNGNCQIGSIAHAQNILHHNKKFIIEVLQEFHKITMRPMWLLDIKKDKYDKVIDLLGKKNINIESDYTSTNSSSMVLALYKTSNLLNIKV